MTRLSAELVADRNLGRFRPFLALTRKRIEVAALVATDRAAQIAKRGVRDAMQSANLGRLGYAIDATSDLRKNGAVHRSGAGSSASGVVFVRSRSARTRGAIDAYTRGADIRPVRARWLWIPTEEIQRVSGKGKQRRLTPGNWKELGMDSKIGPLITLRRKGGTPIMVVENVSVAASGRKRGARSLTKRGAARKGQLAGVSIVAFVAIPFTARAGRVDIPAIVKQARSELPELFAQALERTF